MTLGQRIQELRKQKNLSQEALGEALGVSRQAISKWEGDLTIPELDKLIALSKLFDLPLGQLLGLEESVDQPGQTEELTEGQLAAVEHLLARYREAAEQQSRNHRFWLLLAAAVEVLVLLVLSIGLFRAYGQIQRNDSRLDSLTVKVNDMSYSVGNQISSALNQMEAMLGERDSLVENWDYELTGIQRGGLCTLELWVAPKVYEPWTTAQLTLTSGDRSPVTVAGEWDGQLFRFEAKLYASQDVQVRYVQTNDVGVQQTENLADIGDLARRTQLDLDVDYSGSFNFYSMRDPKRIDANWWLQFDVNGYTAAEVGVKPGSLQLRLVKDGEVVDRRYVELEPFVNDGQRWYKEERWETTLQAEEGEEYKLNYCLEDNLGQIYQGEIFHYVVEKRNGRLVTVSQPVETPAVPVYG